MKKEPVNPTDDQWIRWQLEQEFGPEGEATWIFKPNVPLANLRLAPQDRPGTELDKGVVDDMKATAQAGDFKPPAFIVWDSKVYHGRHTFTAMRDEGSAKTHGCFILVGEDLNLQRVTSFARSLNKRNILVQTTYETNLEAAIVDVQDKVYPTGVAAKKHGVSLKKVEQGVAAANLRETYKSFHKGRVSFKQAAVDAIPDSVLAKFPQKWFGDSNTIIPIVNKISNAEHPTMEFNNIRALDDKARVFYLSQHTVFPTSSSPATIIANTALKYKSSFTKKLAVESNFNPQRTTLSDRKEAVKWLKDLVKETEKLIEKLSGVK